MNHMFTYLVLLFTVLPAIELALLIKLGAYIGAANTILIIVATGVAGAYLARLQGFFVFKKIQENLNKGIMPSDELMDGLMILIGGILLLTPGFITDTMGFILLIPLSRKLIKVIIRKQFEEMIKRGEVVYFGPAGRSHGYDDIDVN